MKTESKKEQYAGYLRNGGKMTMEQWENDSRYDRHLAGETQAGAADHVFIRPDIIDHTGMINYLIDHVAGGTLRPHSVYNEQTKKYEKESKHDVWGTLMYAFTERHEFDEFWHQRPFRRVMHNVVEISKMMERAALKEFKEGHGLDEFDCAAEFFCFGVSEEEHEGTILLKQAIELLYTLDKGDRINLEEVELDYLSFSIQIMIQCQRLSLAMEKKD